MDDSRLVRRMLQGEQDAFQEFFDGHFPRLYRFALTRVADEDAAEEIVQATLIQAVNKLSTFRGEPVAKGHRVAPDPRAPGLPRRVLGSGRRAHCEAASRGGLTMIDDSDSQPRQRDDDSIARLLRLAGTRPSASIERTDRVRGRTHAQWTRVVRARRRRRQFATTAAALALTAMVLLVIQLSTGRGQRPTAPATVVATLTAASGPVVFDSLPLADAPADLPVGGNVTATRTIRTRSGVLAALSLVNGVVVRLDGSTRLRIDSPQDLSLVEGRVYLDASGNGSSLQVRTPLGEVRDVGTIFEVRVGDGQLRVRVRDGEVVVSSNGAMARAGRGTEVLTGIQGLVTRDVATFGASWEWAAKAGPPFDIDGKSVADFLDWVSREGGYQISYDDGARQAAAAVLQGSIEGLTPEEALEVVLPSTGLDHRVIDGRVIVRSQ